MGLLGAFMAMLGLMVLILGFVELWEEEKYRLGTVLLATGIILLFIISPAIFYISGTQDGIIEGRDRFQGTPTNSLEEGKRYRILALAYINTTGDGLLVLSSISDKNILLYTAPLNTIEGLSINDTVVFSEHRLIKIRV